MGDHSSCVSYTWRILLGLNVPSYLYPSARYIRTSPLRESSRYLKNLVDEVYLRLFYVLGHLYGT